MKSSRRGVVAMVQALASVAALASLVATTGCTAATSEDESESLSADALSKSGNRYVLPWAVGLAHAVGQGDMGVLPGGGHSDHTEHLCNGVGQCGQLMIHAIDFEMSEGDEVVASNEGVVRSVYALTRPGDPCFHGDGNTGKCAGKENSVVVAHPDGLETQYLHFSEVRVHAGQHVARGTVLGLAGSTGQSSGPHLHFQVQRPCGATMCQSLPIAFADGVGLPKVGSDPVRSSDAAQRCWSDALSRYVQNACVEAPDAEGTWRECDGGTWRTLAAGEQCGSGASVYGFCKTESGAWVPPRSCHAFPVGDKYDWKQCAVGGTWMTGVAAYAASPVGGPIGECAGLR